jgi:hypothetical protein
MQVYEAPTGWVARTEGLATHAKTREAAIREHEAILRLVERLASKWSPPTSDPSEPERPVEQSQSDAQE